jgi:L-amino acid N-acyltransferase
MWWGRLDAGLMKEKQMNSEQMNSEPTRLVDCTYEQHATAILDIFNEAIANSTALYDYKPRAPDAMTAWFAAKTAGQFPVLGIETSDGTLMGFASYGTFRAWPAYKYSVEHSVYIHRDFRGQGLGRQLMAALIERAQQQNKHVMVGAIDLANAVSISMHEKLGFQHCGVVKQAAFKFGRWLDLALMQLVLATPLEPVDG